MKQILVILCLLIGTSWATVSAQKVQSTSRSLTIIKEPKEPKISQPHNWYVKAGAGLLLGEGTYSHGGYANGTCFKPNIALGYQKQFTQKGLYWGAQTGFTFFPGHADDEFESKAGIYLGPTLGIKKTIGDSLVFDGHMGASFAYSFENAGFGPLWEIGTGLWINRFLIELMYQGSYMDDSYTNYTRGTGILINFGFKF